MSYESRQQNPNPGGKKFNLESIRTGVLQEQEKVRQQYGLSEKTPIYKDNDGKWRLSTPPFPLLEELKKEKDTYEKGIADLHKRNDNADLYGERNERSF